MTRPALMASFLLVCGAAVAQEPALNTLQAEGKQIYQRACSYCHGERLWGTNRLARRVGAERALLEQRTDLTAELIRSAARVGLGGMPPYRRSELTDAELNAVAAYLTRKR